jgi:hypothetical protein
MPSGIYPVPPRSERADPRHGLAPSLWQRLRTWWQRDQLDEQLAQGRDQEATPALRLRAEQLASPAARIRLAATLGIIVRQAGEEDTVRACAPDLLELAERLRDGNPIDVRGAAMTRRLLAQRPTSPRHDDDATSLCEAARAARVALDGAEPGENALPAAA